MPTVPATGPLTVVACVRYVPDAEEIGVHPATRSPDLARATCRINNFDENGVEAAVRLRDECGGRALAVSVVAQRPPTQVLLRVLSMGIDEVHLVCDRVLRDCDALATAEILAALIGKLGAAQVVVCGDASVDEYRGEVGPRLAEALGIPSISHATAIALRDGRVRADRVRDSRVETVEAPLPVLLTVGSATNQVRLPALPQILRARRKPVREWPLDDLVAPEVHRGSAARLRTLSMRCPPETRKRIAVPGDTAVDLAHALLRQLRADAAIVE